MLPVMVAPTDMAAVPAYLKDVTILTPHGNVAAEVATAVDALVRARFPARARMAAAAVAVIVLAAIALFLFWPEPEFDILLSAPNVERSARGFLGSPDLYKLPVSISNAGQESAAVTNVRIETEPANALIEHAESAEPGKMPLGKAKFTPVGRAEARATDGIHSYSTSALFSLKDAQTPPKTWKLCADVNGRSQCDEARPWRPTGTFIPELAFSLPDDIAKDAVGVAFDGKDFVVATKQPDMVRRLSAKGEVVAQISLDREPTVINSGPLGTFVGVRPYKLLKLDPKTLKPVAELLIQVPATMKGAFQDPVSATPVSIAQDGHFVWILTRGGASGTGLFIADAQLNTLEVPPCFNKVAFDLRDMHLISDKGAVWGAQTNTTPTSLHKFTPDQYVEFDGHDYDSVSCATDVAARNDELLVPACNGELQLVERPTSGITVLQGLGQLGFAGQRSGAWVTLHLIALSKQTVAAVNVNHDPARWQTSLQVLDARGDKTLLYEDGAHIGSIAANATTVLALLEAKDGRRQLVAIRLQQPGLR